MGQCFVHGCHQQRRLHWDYSSTCNSIEPTLMVIFFLVIKGHFLNFGETSVKGNETSRTLLDTLDLWKQRVYPQCSYCHLRQSYLKAILSWLIADRGWLLRVVQHNSGSITFVMIFSDFMENLYFFFIFHLIKIMTGMPINLLFLVSSANVYVKQ